MKMKHFMKHWLADLQAKVRDAAEGVIHFACFQSCVPIIYHLQFKQRYEKLNSDSVMPLQAKKGWRSASNMTALLCELNSSDDNGSSDDAGPSAMQTDLTKP
jgi:hypothetical protein